MPWLGETTYGIFRSQVRQFHPQFNHVASPAVVNVHTLPSFGWIISKYPAVALRLLLTLFMYMTLTPHAPRCRDIQDFYGPGLARACAALDVSAAAYL